jgi:DNA-binding transcriptional regulator YdaS (Cro superfamily)
MKKHTVVEISMDELREKFDLPKEKFRSVSKTFDKISLSFWNDVEEDKERDDEG